MKYAHRAIVRLCNDCSGVLALCVLCFSLVPLLALATICYVPSQYATIQAAINASADGDEIIVSPSTYVENINFNGKNIILRSTDPTSATVVAATVIDGSAAGSVVTFSGTELTTCVLSGFTITGGFTCWAQNGSTSTTCAEEDNINVPIFGEQVTDFRVVASHPSYCPCEYDSCPEDWSGCTSNSLAMTSGKDVCTKIWDNDGINVVEVCTVPDWWRSQTMTCVVDGQTTACHYLVLYRKFEGKDSWPQFFVLYQDANMRLKPHAPESPSEQIEDICFGSSVIVGPASPAERPYADIQRVEVHPTLPSLDITYMNDERAHISLTVDRSQAVAQVHVDYTCGTEVPFATFRSMWVDDGTCDVARIQSADGDFPILGSWTSLNGPCWFAYREIQSSHNNSAPDLLIEVLPSTTPTATPTPPSLQYWQFR
jgi:hypothetical protein